MSTENKAVSFSLHTALGVSLCISQNMLVYAIVYVHVSHVWLSEWNFYQLS